MTYSVLKVPLNPNQPTPTVSLDGVAPSWMVSVSASVNLPLHQKVQKFSSGTGSPGWYRKKGRKMVVAIILNNETLLFKCLSVFHFLHFVKIVEYGYNITPVFT